MKPSPKLQNLGRRRRCEQSHHAPGVEGRSGLKVSQQTYRVWAFSSSSEGKIVTRRQYPQSVMVWAAVTETGRSPLFFVPSGVKLNSQRYIAHILEGCLLPSAKKHFQGVSWSLQQDSAPSHASKITQSWIQRKIPSFIRKEV